MPDAGEMMTVPLEPRGRRRYIVMTDRNDAVLTGPARKPADPATGPGGLTWVNNPNCDHATRPEPGGEPAGTDVCCALGPGLESVGAGRRFTRRILRDWGLAGLCEPAELVVSELVTNAIRHGLLSARPTIEEYPVGLRLLARTPFVTCLVTDPGQMMPVCGQAAPDAETGRGLQVVESCSLRWGWRPLAAGGKVVWALLHDA
jgi:hypothetical protein